MTGELYMHLLKMLDRKMELSSWKTLLLVDKVEVELQRIELAFFPANTTVVLELMTLLMTK